MVRDGNKLWINECAKVRDNAGQRIVEVFVFSASETMSFHHDAAAEKVIALIQARYPCAFIRGKEVFDNRVAFRVEIFRNLIPLDCRNCAGRSHFVSKTTRTSARLTSRFMLSNCDHSFQCAVVQNCGSNSFGSSFTSARMSEYFSVVTTLPSTMKITSGAIQPPPSF